MTEIAIPESGSVAAASADLGAELVANAITEHRALATVGPREQLLAAAWLVGCRSARTRRGYAGDYVAWIGWLTEHQVDVLATRRVHVDLWVQESLAAGVENSTMARRLAALTGFYRHAAANDLVDRVPTDGVSRPAVDPDHTDTIGLTREQARVLIAAADADRGHQRLRTAALIRLLLHNALRVDEACAANVTDLGYHRGHRTLTIVRKGNRRTRVALAAPTVAALDSYLKDRAAGANIDSVIALTGPLFSTTSGGRLDQSALWKTVRRLGRVAGLPFWADLSPHSLRHTAITLAIDAGASLRDVQDYAGHRDARTTRRYDHSRHSLDRHAAYTVAAWLAD